METLRESLKDSKFSQGLWRVATNRVQAIMEAYPGYLEPDVAAALDAIDSIKDVLVTI